MNESWSLRWSAKLSGALDKMIEGQTKSYTDKLQDITCARACSHLRLANTSRRFQCACSGDMKTLKLPSSHSPRHSLGHSIGQTDNTLGSAANGRNAQGSTSKRLKWATAVAVASVIYTLIAVYIIRKKLWKKIK